MPPNEAAVSDRSQSNISIGYNHAPSSDRHFSSTNLEEPPSKDSEDLWPVGKQNGVTEAAAGNAGSNNLMFKDELEGAND